MSEYERSTPSPGNKERTPEEIQREIELTRERMGRDIDALGERLSPENLKRQAKEAITGKAHDMVNNVGYQARDTGTRLFDFVRDNQLPVAAVSVAANCLSQQGNRIAERAGEVRERAGEIAGRAGELAGTARERVSDFGSTARERAGDQARRARGGFDRMMEESPLAVAAGATILGLLIGLLVPESERENRLMGPTRDNLVDRAQTTAQRVKEVAIEAGNEVREAVREEASSRAPEIKSTLKEAAATVGAQVKGAAERVKEEAKQAAKQKPV